MRLIPSSRRTLLLTREAMVKEHPWTVVIVWSYIETCYRTPGESTYECLQSLLYLHNESFNAWSHILSTLWLLLLTIKTISHLTDISELVVLLQYCFGMLCGFGFSGYYHTFCCHSFEALRPLQCMDWFGIIAMVFTSSLMVSYFEFRATPVERKQLYPHYFEIFNLFNVSFFMAIYYMLYTNIYTHAPVQDNSGKSNNNNNNNKRVKARAAAAGSAGGADSESVQKLKYIVRCVISLLYAGGPLFACGLKSLADGTPSASFGGLLTSYLFYSSVFLCLFHIPERLLPVGTTDIFGCSHNIFHATVVVGATSLWHTYYIKCQGSHESWQSILGQW